MVVNKMNIDESKDKLICNALLVGLNNKEIFQECLDKTGATLTSKNVLEIAEKVEKKSIMLKNLGEISTQKLAQSAMQMGAGSTTEVSAVRTRMVRKPVAQNSDCNYCTRKHPPGKANCPAKDAQCHVCQKKGHWAAKCRSKQDAQKPKP